MSIGENEFFHYNAKNIKATYDPEEKGVSEGINFYSTNINDTIKDILNKLNELIINFDNLSDYEKFKYMKILYYFMISYEDLAVITNILYGTNFSKVITLSTTIEEDISDFGLIKKYGISLDCATKAEFIPLKKRYSYEEITQLINNGTIYPLFARALRRFEEFDLDEINTQTYFNAEENEDLVNILLENKNINTLVPNTIKLVRESGDAYFQISDLSINERTAKLFMILFKDFLTKKNVFMTIKDYILELKSCLNNAYNNTFDNELEKIKSHLFSSKTSTNSLK